MRRVVISLMVALVIMGSSVLAYAHSGRTRTDSWGRTGHTNRSTGVWETHY